MCHLIEQSGGRLGIVDALISLVLLTGLIDGRCLDPESFILQYITELFTSSTKREKWEDKPEERRIGSEGNTALFSMHSKICVVFY